MPPSNRNLFSWEAVDQLPDLNRLRLALDYLPDQEIIQALEEKRGRGRNEYPVGAMWRATVAGIVFQHDSVASLMRELQRNPALLELCGFDPLPRQKAPLVRLVPDEGLGRMVVERTVPQPACLCLPGEDNFSRFFANLIDLEGQRGLVRGMIPRLRTQLMAALPDFGVHMGYDGKAIESHSTGQKNRQSQQTSDADADWGKHETAGVDARTGKQWKKIKSWFGYTLHLIADSHYEIPVAFEITPASQGESPQLKTMIHDLCRGQGAHGPIGMAEIAQRCETFSADRGLDCTKTKRMLWDDYRIRPFIDTRQLWREEKQAPDYEPGKVITRPLYPDRADTIVYTEKGSVHCICPHSGELKDMAFQGFEADRNALKYRCPAAAYGLQCDGMSECHRRGGVQPGDYGRIVRVPLKTNRRIFTPTPHGSPSWKRGYNRRTALERINARIDNDFGFEKHYIRGQTKMQTRVGLALAVMMAMALGQVHQGRKQQIRSLVGSIPPPVLNTA